MSHRYTVLFAVLLLCAGRVQAAVPETPRLRLLGVAEGLPSSSINALARDRAGYLWIATPDGLARYDGVGFRLWRHVPDDPAALPGNIVQALHVDAADRVWVATEFGGLSVLDAARGGFRHYRQAAHPEIGSDDTWAFASRDGVLWFGTGGGGLHRLDRDGRITRYTTAEGLPSDTVLALAFDRDGGLWIGTDAGLARFAGGHLVAQPLPGADPGALIYSLTLDDDALWVGSAAGVWQRTRQGRWWQPPWSPMFERPNAMTTFARDRDGDGALWIGSQRGLWRAAPDGIPTPVALGGRSVDKPLQALLRQDDGALWVPVAGAGLGYLRADWRRVAQVARSPQGLSAELYRAITPARAGGVWLGGYNGEVEHLAADGTVEPLAAAERQRLAGARLAAIVEDHAGRLWLGHRQGLLRVGRDGSIDEWRVDDAHDPVPAGQVNLLRIAGDGSLWLSTQGGGIQRRDPATGAVLLDLAAGAASGLGTADTEALEVAPDGSLWIAGAAGLARLARGQRRFVAVAPMQGARVFGFGFDGDATLWLHRMSGLERYQRTGTDWRRTATVSGGDGVPAVESAGLRIDAAHRVWLSTPRGLFRWDPRARGLRRFGVQNGLGSQEFVDRALALTATGTLAAATADGAVVLVDTLATDLPTQPPRLRFDSFAVRRDGQWQEWPGGKPIALAPDEHELRVRTRLLAFDDPAANRIWTRLDGFDPDWVAQDVAGERVFTALPPGAYTLRARAVDATGHAAAEQALSFAVLPPWWRTRWAQAGALALGLLLLGGIAAGYRARLRRRHAWQLAAQQRQLAEQASEAKTRFLATLGHEVRTPMTGVLGMSELLLGTALDPRQRGYTQSIRHAGEHLLRLVNDALDLARIEAGKLALVAADFDLHALLDELAALQAPLAAQRGLAFGCEIALDVPRGVRGDPLRLRQILLNLLGNALKFTERGGVGLQVATLGPHGLRFTVSDTGPGLDAGQQARLFQRFEQADGVRTAARYGGSGLGLAICQELVAAMGGHITVASVPGAGSRFSVELPWPAAAPPAAPTPVATPGASASTWRSGRALLLVEDDATVAEVITGLLRAQGHRVTHAAHGLAALVEVAAAGFDLVLLDLDLPGMDGCALARQLRAQGFAAPLLVVTARADAEAEAAARAAGCHGFLRKPVTGALLGEAIAALLRTEAENETDALA
jgi:ligand-binding sensor domain-containing protein/CheY-like chemotaxis protein